jgi:hypothetical protein
MTQQAPLSQLLEFPRDWDRALAVVAHPTVELGIASLTEHRAYPAALGWHSMAAPDDFLRAAALQTAQRSGGRHATSFEVFQM